MAIKVRCDQCGKKYRHLVENAFCHKCFGEMEQFIMRKQNISAPVPIHDLFDVHRKRDKLNLRDDRSEVV